MPDRISILFTIPNFITAGSGRAMLNIIERLDRKRFAPAVCVMKKGAQLDREVERLVIPFLEAPFTVAARPYHTLLRRARQAAQAFQPYRFGLWHSFHYADDYTEAIIARLAGASGWVYTKKNMNWHTNAWYIRTLLALGVVAQNSDMLRNFFGGRLFRRKAYFVPRGVEVDRFHPEVSPCLNVRHCFGIPADASLVGCVAHLLPVKGQRTLLEAIALRPDVYLILAGKPLDQDYAASLKHQATKLNIGTRVIFLDFVENVPALLVELDIFVLATWDRWRREGCPVSLLEAMACGKACVATDIPGSRDLIEHGQSGWLVPPEDPAALASALARLSANSELRRRLGASARARVLSQYTIAHEVAAHEAFYEDILFPKTVKLEVK